MKQGVYWWVFFLVQLVGSCTKTADISDVVTVPRIVIEGRVSSLEGPYYVRITKSMGLAGSTDTLVPVKGATVIITEDTGLSDTLIPSTDAGPILFAYRYHAAERKIDSTLEQVYTNDFSNQRGYYETTRLKGRPGHTYSLLVKVGDQEYRASARMPPAPVLDSVKLQEAVVLPNGATTPIPFVYFSEPQQETNFYQLSFNDIRNYRRDNEWFGVFIPRNQLPFYVLKDQTLPPYVNGIGVRVIESDHYDELSSWPYLNLLNAAFQVRLCSLSKEAYEFFDSLNRQLQDDGNVYKPVPSSAPGNISNHAIGLFWASDIAYRVYLPN